jgi:hypothetical protein
MSIIAKVTSKNTLTATQVTNKNKLKVHHISYKLYDSMRRAISDQIMNYRNNNRGNKEICALCGISNRNNNIFENGVIEFHVDHKEPSFMSIRDSFINEKKNQGVIIPTIFNDDEFNIPNFREEDESFKNDWWEYHRSNATYQILCKLCNLRKKKL